MFDTIESWIPSSGRWSRTRDSDGIFKSRVMMIHEAIIRPDTLLDDLWPMYIENYALLNNTTQR